MTTRIMRKPQKRVARPQSPVVKRIRSSDEQTSESDGKINPPQATQHYMEEAEMEAEQVVARLQTEDGTEIAEEIGEYEADPPENSIMSQIELIWTPTVLSLILPILKASEVAAMKAKDLTSKRLFVTAITLWKQIQAILIHGNRKHLLQRCTWTDFISVLRDEELFTTFC